MSMETVTATEPLPRTKERNLLSNLRTWPWLSILILGGTIFIAIFAPLISPNDPTDMELLQRLDAPSWLGGRYGHFLGTDVLGRDLLTRIFFGARVSLIVAIFGLLLGGGIGLLIGLVSGFYRGKIDTLLMGLSDCFMALPTLLIALVFVMTLGPGLTTIVVALSIVTWSRFSRIIRSEVLALRQREFVLQAQVAGSSSLRILWVHILPNVLNTFIVVCSLQVSQLILTEATLSFLGAGIPPPTPSWGNMVSDGRTYITSAWWISVFPGVALTAVVLSFNTLGDWLRDRLDPKLRQL